MSQIYNQLRYIPNISTYILPKTPYFDPKKITRASFLFARVKSVGIRSVLNTVRLNIKNPEPFPVQGFRLLIKHTFPNYIVLFYDFLVL